MWSGAFLRGKEEVKLKVCVFRKSNYGGQSNRFNLIVGDFYHVVTVIGRALEAYSDDDDDATSDE